MKYEKGEALQYIPTKEICYVRHITGTNTREMRGYVVEMANKHLSWIPEELENQYLAPAPPKPPVNKPQAAPSIRDKFKTWFGAGQVGTIPKI